MRKIILSVLCFCLLFSCLSPVYAENSEEKHYEMPEKLYIENEEDFLAFAENCRLDSYSRNLRVYLKSNLDLSDYEFDGVPIFSGTFLGNGHKIVGVNLKGEGSVQGFFRYLTKDAKVLKLNIQGKMIPQGSGSKVGGIAGSNAGEIRYCTFFGEVSGSDRVGGIAGTNGVTGIVERCDVHGTVHGEHFTGGVAGENTGLIRNCDNYANVNAEECQNKIELSSISIETMSGVESPNTVTDIGGIAGTNVGVIRSCDNMAVVGYQHIGYNVGGIAGSQQGYITGCHNSGRIYGRKEVGGIVGQMEPVTKLEYSEDTLQILQKQLAETAALTDQAASNAQNNAAGINGQISALQSQANTAKEAVESLIPSRENPRLPDKDSFLAAKNAFNSSMTGMQNTMRGIASSTQSTINTLNSDISAISAQMNTMSTTLGQATDNLGATFSDVSDEDTNDILVGKIERSINNGIICGDLNVGGIAGAIAWENDLDPEDDIQLNGKNSLKFDSQVRAVVTGCENRGEVEVKKRNAGGIVGWMSLGLLRDCGSCGSILAENAQYAGGIAGNSTGYIRNCSAKCEVFAQRYAGGIAGSGAVVTDCRSVAAIEGASENAGGILGVRNQNHEDEENPFSGNYYLLTDRDQGAVDGISYAGLGEPMKEEDFYSLPQMRRLFLESTVIFLTEDGEELLKIVLHPGDVLEKSQVPAVPEKSGYVGEWINLNEQVGKKVFFDRIYRPCYTAYRTTVESEVKRPDGRPVLLAQGEFPRARQFPAEQLTQFPLLEGKETGVETWKIPKLDQAEEIQLRYAVPEEYEPERMRVEILDRDGNWRKAEIRVSDSYLVFTAECSDRAFCTISIPEEIPWLMYIGSGVLAAAILTIVIIVICKKRKKKKNQMKQEKQETVPPEKKHE